MKREGDALSRRPAPDAVARVGVVGTGVIGAGWAAHFLGRGKEVLAWDPAADAEARLRERIGRAWPSLERIGLAAGASRERMTFLGSAAEVAAGAQVIQESAPERLDLKIDLLAELDRHAAPETVLISSTSGYAMSDMQAACAHPERMVVGHPFNPPYLLPLVEVVGGKRTDPETVDWTMAFYRAIAKRPLRLRRELPGFVANRLLEAVWREALHMVAEGEATVAEIDAAMAYGPGLRYAVMGPCLTFHLAGGAGGMGHMLDHFGPALEEPWTRLAAPELTRELRERMVAGCEREAAGRSIDDLEAQRDDCLIGIMAALADYWAAADALTEAE